MIVDNKEILSQEEPPADSPPAYDEVPPSPRFHTEQKSQRAAAQNSSQAGPSSRTSATPPFRRPPSSTNMNWFGLGSWFSEKGTQKEVKQTIQSLIRDVVKEPSSPAAVSVLHSCLEACQARGLSFESIVSEKFIEGHPPLYWAIVKRPASSPDPPDDQVHLLDILLTVPLNHATRLEAYLACLLSSDQVLFQRLRRTPGIHVPSLSAADEILLGEVPEDRLFVQNVGGDHGEFRVNWKIAQFQKRMRVVGGVGTEFVARGRIWSLVFTVLPRDATSSGAHIKAGSWVASVSLLAPSPPTHLDAQFSIAEPLPIHSPLPAAPPSRWRSSKQKNPIDLRVKTDSVQLEPLPLHSMKQDLREHVLTRPGSKTLIVPLSNHYNGGSLQFDGCTYMNPDESLDVKFDARLAKPGTGECVIC